MRKILNFFSLLFHASTYRKLKDKWEIKSNFQLVIILIVFAITGSTSAAISGPTIDFLFGKIEMNGFLKFILQLVSYYANLPSTIVVLWACFFSV